MEYFIAAVEHGSFTKAAQERFVSQTAMSQQIAAMEQELDFLLFDRSGYRPSLTLAGKAFYESSKQIIADYQQAVKKVAKDQLIFTTPNQEVIKQCQDQGIDTRYADFFDNERLLGQF